MNRGPAPGTWTTRLAGWPRYPFAAALLIGALLALGALGFAVLEQRRSSQEERFAITNQLGITRAHLEGALNSRLLLGRGLVSYVALHPDITQEQCPDCARKLYGEEDGEKPIS